MYDSKQVSDQTMSCGYSPIAMVVAIAILFVMVLVLFGIGFVPLQPGTNLVGSCSVAMSAACHPLPSSKSGGQGLAFQKLKWGVVSARPGEVGHCSFSDGAVEMPQKGELYAGS